MPKIVLPNNIILPEVERLLADGKEVTMKVKGNSMLPFIVGDRDSVVLSKAHTLNIGDIALARLDNNQYVIHRIIGISKGGVTLMGDGNLVGTEICKASDISGQVTKVIRNGKYIDVNTDAEKRNVRLWRQLRHVRRYLLAIYRRIM